MITYTSSRNNGGHIYEGKPEQRTVSNALELMLIYEFGYGGQLIELTKTKVAVRTTVMACVDLSTFEGSEEDMVLLTEAAYLATEYHPMKPKAPEAYKDAAMDVIMSVTKGIPLLIKMSYGILLGTPAVKAALIDMIRSEDEAIIGELLKFSHKELLPIMMLVRQDGVSVADAIDLAKAEPTFGVNGKVNGLTV